MTHFDKNQTTPLAEKLISLYAEYVEGCIDSSRVEYNKLIGTANVIDAFYIIYHTPFEQHSVNMFDNLIKLNQAYNIPKEVMLKVERNRAYIAMMKELINSNNLLYDHSKIYYRIK